MASKKKIPSTVGCVDTLIVPLHYYYTVFPVPVSIDGKQRECPQRRDIDVFPPLEAGETQTISLRLGHSPNSRVAEHAAER